MCCYAIIYYKKYDLYDENSYTECAKIENKDSLIFSIGCLVAFSLHEIRVTKIIHIDYSYDEIVRILKTMGYKYTGRSGYYERKKDI